MIGFVGAHDDALELLELALESCRTRRSVRARRIRLGSGKADPATRDSRQGSLDTQSSRPVTEGPLRGMPILDMRRSQLGRNNASHCAGRMPSDRTSASPAARGKQRDQGQAPKEFECGPPPAARARSGAERRAETAPGPDHAAVPPTVSPSTRKVGWPTPAGTLCPPLPHMPTPSSSAKSLPMPVTRA